MAESLSKNEKFFISEVNRFIRYFNLLSWDVRFKKIKNDKVKAQCAATDDDGNVNGLAAEMQYDQNWIKYADLEDISYTAFHETMELLLMSLRIMIADPEKYHTCSEVDSEMHRVINTLSNTVYKDFLEPKIDNKKEK